MKKTKFLEKGRKIIFSLALFLFVFAAASVVKIQAAGNVTGWLWGGSEDNSIGGVVGSGIPDGNETGVGWISMSGTNYGVTMPPGNGPVTGYAWANAGGEPDNGLQNGIGWIQFDPAGGGVSVATAAGERRLSGKARIVSIANAGENAGGWLGWIKMAGDGANWNGSSCVGINNYNNNDRCNYGVKIDSSTGQLSGYAWSDELGWIDFSRAKLLMPIDGQCKTPPNNDSFCPGETPNPETMNAAELCNSYDPANPPSVSGTWNWTCSGQNGGSPMPCLAELGVAIVPECNDDINFCTGNISSPCVSGTASAFSNEENYEASWTCTGSCPTTTINCSAKGKKACGWVETN